MRLVDDGERLLRFNRLAGRNFNFLEGPTDRRDDGNLHLHRFHDHHDVVFFDVIADLDVVQKLDLFEDFDVIERLDSLPARSEG